MDPEIKTIPFLQPRLKARLMVKDYVESRLDKSDPPFELDADKDIYVVWFSKVLQNWKALLSTNLPDGMYYEVTYNGDNHEAYLDAYKKFENVTYPDPCH